MDDIELDAIRATIRRNQAESDKLSEETRKFVAEQHKLYAEGQKFQRERTTTLITAIAAACGASTILGGALVKFMSH